MQSHLSVTNSQRRLRVSPSSSAKLPVQSQGLVGTNIAASFFHFNLQSLSNSWLPLQLGHPIGEGHSPRSRSWQRVCWKWAAFLYSSLCVIFMSLRLLQQVQQRLAVHPPPPSIGQGPFIASYLDGLPTLERLSRVTSVYPHPVTVDPFVLRAEDDAAGPTACLWCLDQDLGLLTAWASRWRGPISLLVITMASPSSHKYKKIMARLQSLKSQAELRLSLSVHVLHVESESGTSPNVYLNIARLFAPSREVILFPTHLKVFPPHNAYTSIVSQAAPAPKPAIVASGIPPSFKFSGHSAIMLDRDHHLWCTERFLYFNSRALSWEECLWQVWLESLGEISVIKVNDWPFEGPGPSKAAVHNDERIHRRLSNNYRSETCDSRAKQLAMVQESSLKARWLKQFCRRETVRFVTRGNDSMLSLQE